MLALLEASGNFNTNAPDGPRPGGSIVVGESPQLRMGDLAALGLDASGINTRIKQKSPRFLRDLGGYKAPSSKCPLTKAAVSVTSGSTFDGYDGTGPLYKIHDVLNFAETNFTAEHLGQYVMANYNYYSSYTGPWSPGDQAVVTNPSAGKIGKPFDFTTMLEGSYLGFASLFVAGLWRQEVRLWIDDEEITDWYLGNRATGVLQGKSEIDSTALGTANHIYNINFPKRGLYKVRSHGLITTLGGAASNSPTAGNFLLTNSKSRLLKPAPRPQIGVISDSWFEAIYTNTIQSVAGELSHHLNANIWNLAQGGSGFVNPSGDGANGDRSFSKDLVWEAVDRVPHLDLLIVNGSANDLPYSDAEVLAAMQATFDRARDYDPDIPIVWAGIQPVQYFKGLHTFAAMKARENLLIAKAQADPNVVAVIPTCNEEWMTGTGKTNGVTNDGNQDFMIGPDGIHLSLHGAKVYGKMYAERMKSALAVI